MATPSNSDPDMAEKGESKEVEGAGIDRQTTMDGINHHSWDNHTSFAKYPTHEPGFENKVRLQSKLEGSFVFILTV
jgi:hypothetical protein